MYKGKILLNDQTRSKKLNVTTFNKMEYIEIKSLNYTDKIE